jgi:hypothetical protein
MNLASNTYSMYDGSVKRRFLNLTIRESFLQLGIFSLKLFSLKIFIEPLKALLYFLDLTLEMKEILINR